MYLPLSCCIICSAHIAKVKYNLKTTCSEKSNLVLIKLVEKYYRTISFLHCNICQRCYDLLNELDTVRHREKELCTQLKTYISKLEDCKSNVMTQNDVDDMTDSDFLCSTLPTDSVEDDILTFTDDEQDIKIADIDLKKLPIKIKRVPSKVNHHSTFESISKLKTNTHTQKDLDENEKVFEQIQSSIQMDLSKHVEEYMNKCKPAKNVLCEICGQNFKTKSGYENHLKKHDNVEDDMKLLALNKLNNNWFCNVCGKNFNQKGALARHLAIHTGETRYQCEECGKKFLHHSSFQMHRKIHAGQRLFKCETCNHSFLTNSHLKRHKRSTHNKEKKHVCTLCGKKFTENYNLIGHTKVVHKDAINIDPPQEEDRTIVYYQVQEEVLVKGETLIHMEESPTTVLYNL